MHVAILPITLALTHLLAPTLATPLPTTPPPLLSPRSQFCSNAPTTKAGTLLTRDALPPPALLPRHSTSTILWCAPATQTYIIFTMGQPIPGAIISSMLNVIINMIHIHIQRMGDTVLRSSPTYPTTVFNWNGEGGVKLNVGNSNNHQTTWGVLGAALSALQDYMLTRDAWGSVEFTIFDGANEVGKGTLR